MLIVITLNHWQLVMSPVPPPKPTFITVPPPSSPIRGTGTQTAPPMHPSPGATSGQDRIIPSQPQGSSNLPGEPHSTSASMPSDPQSERATSDTRTNTTTRSGRVVRPPNRYKE
ncbi:hypothetical protein ElyMa_004595500 [Elysia marginata]|uniref:Uncharacterized protein n=1 Tax=Elysia marginata TaxID=1093978 RepID=A0AAV4HVM4_9GAST|nr:hypothetical protein ElyMa_004595500 [Elysia marginata]